MCAYVSFSKRAFPPQINEVNFYRARTTIASAESFDPLTGAWEETAPLPETRSEAGAVVV